MPRHVRAGGLGRTISSGFRLVSAFKVCSLCWACWKRRAVVVKARVAILEAIAAVMEWMSTWVARRLGGRCGEDWARLVGVAGRSERIRLASDVSLVRRPLAE